MTRRNDVPEDVLPAAFEAMRTGLAEKVLARWSPTSPPAEGHQ
jgi:hypothetical protein